MMTLVGGGVVFLYIYSYEYTHDTALPGLSGSVGRKRSTSRMNISTFNDTAPVTLARRKGFALSRSLFG